MSNARMRTRMRVGDPAEVDEARREYDKAFARALLNAPGPQYQRSATATLDDEVDKAKASYDIAKRAFHYAEREAKSLEKELFAWQSILNSVKATWNATGVRG